MPTCWSVIARSSTFFSQIDKIIDWNPILGIIEIAYTKGNKATGRPSYDSLVLFKTKLLRTWYGLSDGEVEEQVNDRLAVSITSIFGLEHASKHNYVEISLNKSFKGVTAERLSM